MVEADRERAKLLIVQLRTMLPFMTKQERLFVFEAVMNDYCKHCGRDEGGDLPWCYCRNDE